MSMIAKCSKCHHEWETVRETNDALKCDWCGAKGRILNASRKQSGLNWMADKNTLLRLLQAEYRRDD